MRRLVTVFVLVGFAVGVSAGAPMASGHRKCKPRPLSVQEAHEVPEALPLVAEYRKNGLQAHFERDHREGVRYVFTVTHTPDRSRGLVIDGFEDVNMYTADVVDPVLLCKPEKTTRKLRDLQKALRKSHCLGPVVLKKYRDPKHFSCLE